MLRSTVVRNVCLFNKFYTYVFSGGAIQGILETSQQTLSACQGRVQDRGQQGVLGQIRRLSVSSSLP